jgi:hypothetical protein
VKKNYLSRQKKALIDRQALSLNDLAVWILEFGYGDVNPTQTDIDRVEAELRLIYLYENQLLVLCNDHSFTAVEA